MAPKIVTPWAQTLLYLGELFKELECWQVGGVSFSTLTLGEAPPIA